MGEIDVLLVLMGDKSQVPFWYVHHISLSHLFFANQMRSSLKNIYEIAVMLWQIKIVVLGRF